MAQYGHPSALGKGAREELYSKVTPRRNSQQCLGTIKHGLALDVLLPMSFPGARAQKALVSTGGRSVQAACDWLVVLPHQCVIPSSMTPCPGPHPPFSTEALRLLAAVKADLWK
jgi:hypothetical protein